MIYSVLLTGELQDGFPAQDSSDAVLSSALVFPKISGHTGIFYDQVPINQMVAWIRLNVNICSINQPAVNAQVWIRERKQHNWNEILKTYRYILFKIMLFTLLMLNTSLLLETEQPDRKQCIMH